MAKPTVTETDNKTETKEKKKRSPGAPHVRLGAALKKAETSVILAAFATLNDNDFVRVLEQFDADGKRRYAEQAKAKQFIGDRFAPRPS